MQILIAMAAAAGVLTSLPLGQDRGNVVGYIAAFKGLDREIEQVGFPFWTIVAARMGGLGIGLQWCLAGYHATGNVLIEPITPGIQSCPEPLGIRPMLAEQRL